MYAAAAESLPSTLAVTLDQRQTGTQGVLGDKVADKTDDSDGSAA